MFKVNIKKTPEKKILTSLCFVLFFRVFFLNFEYISHLFLVFLLLTLNKKMLAYKGDLPSSLALVKWMLVIQGQINGIFLLCKPTIMFEWNMIYFHLLTHFRRMVSFYTPWKHQKPRGLLMFLGGIKNISGTKWVS